MLRRSLPFLCLLSIACSAPPKVSTAPAPPQVTLIGARLQVFRGEELVAHGRSAKVNYLRSSGDVVASEALMKFPQAESSQIRGTASGMEIRAAEVTGNLATQQSAASGGVQLKTADGTTGQTSRANFDGKAQKAIGPEPVHLEGAAGWILDAAAFEFLLPEERFSFLGEVVTRSSPRAPDPVPPSGAPR